MSHISILIKKWFILVHKLAVAMSVFINIYLVTNISNMDLKVMLNKTSPTGCTDLVLLFMFYTTSSLQTLLLESYKNQR